MLSGLSGMGTFGPLAGPVKLCSSGATNAPVHSVSKDDDWLRGKGAREGTGGVVVTGGVAEDMATDVGVMMDVDTTGGVADGVEVRL